MKLLKIGSSSSSNIVLNSEFVSSHHAEILLLDSGRLTNIHNYIADYQCKI